MKKHLTIVTFALFAMLTLLILYKLIKGPVHSIRALNISVEQSLEIENSIIPDTLMNNPDVDSLVKLLTYKQALVALSEKDSIQMVIHFPDQMVRLYIHGVPIFQSKMEYSKNSQLLKNLRGNLYFRIFSSPMEISKIGSTIVKEPVIEVQAPKDPIEAELNAFEPDTLIQFPAFVKMELSNGIHINLEQSKDLNLSERKRRLLVKTGYTFSSIWSFSKAIITFRPYIHNPSITIGLPVADLRAIYRALPEHPYLVLYVAEK